MTTEELRSLSQFLADRFYLPQPVLLALILICGLGWICWRTRSLHVVLNRIWRILFGQMIFVDQDIARFAENRSQLIAFRFMSGICSRTLPMAKNLIQWSETYGEDVADIKACGDLFDVEKCRLQEEKIPGRKYRFGLFLFIMALGFCSAFPIVGWLTDRAAYQFTKSRTWFLLSENDAISLFEDMKVTKEACAELSHTPKPIPPYSGEEVQAICKILDTVDIKNNIQKTVTQQRIMFGAATGMLAYFILACVIHFRRIEAALGMKKRLGNRTPQLDAQKN